MNKFFGVAFWVGIALLVALEAYSIQSSHQFGLSDLFLIFSAGFLSGIECAIYIRRFLDKNSYKINNLEDRIED